MQTHRVEPGKCPHSNILEFPLSYINPKLDTLYFSQFREPCRGTVLNEHLEQLHKTMKCLRDLRYLCVEIDAWHRYGKVNPDRRCPAFSKLLGSPQKLFPGLEQFLVIMEDSFENLIGSPVDEDEDDEALRPYGIIELRDPNEALWNCGITVRARTYFEYFAKEHVEARKPPRAIKDISRGGRRGLHYWQIRNDF
jgi:hypothetical protein